MQRAPTRRETEIYTIQNVMIFECSSFLSRSIVRLNNNLCTFHEQFFYYYII